MSNCASVVSASAVSHSQASSIPLCDSTGHCEAAGVADTANGRNASDLVRSALELLHWFKEKSRDLKEKNEQSPHIMQRFLLMEPKVAELELLGPMSMKVENKAMLRNVVEALEAGKYFIMNYTGGADSMLYLFRWFLKSGAYVEDFEQVGRRQDVCLSQLQLSHSLSSEERRQQDMQDMQLHFTALSRQLVANAKENRPGNVNEEDLADFRAMMTDSSGLINKM